MAHMECTFFSRVLNRNADVTIVVPSVSVEDVLNDVETHYYDEEAEFPVLYLLHGSYGGALDWSQKTNIERYAQDHGIAVVLPAAQNSCYVDMHYGENYLKFIGEELPDFLTKILPISRKRENTWISGLSMGGYGALRIGLEYPETFGKVASISGAMDMEWLWQGDFTHAKHLPQKYLAAVFENPKHVNGTENDLIEVLKKAMASGKELPELYMNEGTEDFILGPNEEFYAEATKLGAVVEYERFPGEHCWEYWDKHVQDVIRWCKTS